MTSRPAPSLDGLLSDDDHGHQILSPSGDDLTWSYASSSEDGEASIMRQVEREIALRRKAVVSDDVSEEEEPVFSGEEWQHFESESTFTETTPLVSNTMDSSSPPKDVPSQIQQKQRRSISPKIGKPSSPKHLAEPSSPTASRPPISPNRSQKASPRGAQPSPIARRAKPQQKQQLESPKTLLKSPKTSSPRAQTVQQSPKTSQSSPSRARELLQQVRSRRNNNVTPSRSVTPKTANYSHSTAKNTVVTVTSQSSPRPPPTLVQQVSTTASTSPSKTVTMKPPKPKKGHRRIRFRDPFPVLTPQPPLRPEKVIRDQHEVPLEYTPPTWLKAKPDLQQLVVATQGQSLARRSNACGALKVLLQSKRNQMLLTRTKGFLNALAFGIGQPLKARDGELGLDARRRALSCLVRVVELKENRPVILNEFPLEVLVEMLRQGDAETRLLACQVVAWLCKTPGCRSSIANLDNLIDYLATILGGNLPPEAPPTPSPQRAIPTGVRVVQEEEPDFTDDEDEEGTLEDSEDEDSLRDSEHEEDYDSTRDEKKTDFEDTLPHHDSIRSKNQQHQSDFLQQARLHACACLLHLSKHCPVSARLASCHELLDSLVVNIVQLEKSLSHKCLEILANLTRFPHNCKFLTQYAGVVDALLLAAASPSVELRVLALRALQNLSADSSSKSQLATDSVLSLVTQSALRQDPDEALAGVSCLYNIATDPGAVVSLTNGNVVATLVHLAHYQQSPQASKALATISLWLQTLAGTGINIGNVPLPTHQSTGWERWDN